MSTNVVEELIRAHDTLLALAAGLPSADLRLQFHPDLSPIGWHLGHVAFIGRYWLREVVLGDDSQTRDQHDWFLPERIDKEARVGLPGIDDGAAMAAAYREIEDLYNSVQERNGHAHPLMRDDYIGWFLVQHAAQHCETVCMVLLERHLARQQQADLPLARLQPVTGDTVQWLDIPHGRHVIGSDAIQACDNEQPVYQVDLPAFRIASRPVSNAQYLAFMLDGGYQRDEWWQAAGVDWKTNTNRTAPRYWLGEDDCWCQATPAGVAAIDPDDAVIGLSWFEAAAYARYADACLPVERQWEAAMTSHGELYGSTGGCWEWCANAFHPYEGFRPFPYERYSSPWFDGCHMTLRGSSPYTLDSVRRPAFRNFYTPEKSHVFAGLRLSMPA